MILSRSRFVHLLPLGESRFLAIHAVSHLRLTIDGDIARILDYFGRPRVMPEEMAPLVEALGYPQDLVLNTVANLMDRGLITERSPDEELNDIAAELSATHGRDPDALLESYRRTRAEGALPAWAAGEALGVQALKGGQRRLDVILLGECDIQMETDFLRREGERRGLDIRIAAGFVDDVGLVAERPHDAIIIGALRSRRAVALGTAEEQGGDPSWMYVLEARSALEALRGVTGKPILLDNLPEPTVQPLGMADRGPHGHRNRFRRTNLALAELAEGFDDVHLIDTAAALNQAGSERFLDDGLVGFTHFGSPGWMLQRPQSERAAVFDQFPDLAQLAAPLNDDPYGREAVMARTHVDALITLTGQDRKKCVILDLDGTLWPGVIAETGAPFAWAPEVSGLYSYIGLWFGLHEALKTLKQRGVVLACVSKNDDAVVRQLWTYPDHYPKDRLLTLDDFVATRINWGDKSENITSIAEELGFSLDAFLFIDDNPVERERVCERLPSVEVWGDNLFELRRRLLTDPRLQLPRITAEAAGRTDLVKAQLKRTEARATYVDEGDFLKALNVQSRISVVSDPASLARVVELFQRTTQFNTTGRTYAAGELARLAETGGGVFVMQVSDRYGDHGLSGAAILDGGVITGFAMSCRVIGLKVEQDLLAAVAAQAAMHGTELRGQIIPTDRNTPVRNLYRDSGFREAADGWWTLSLGPAQAISDLAR
jgi:FkbH-like protein